MPAGFTPIDAITQDDELDEFDCGTHSLNHWLKTWARHSHRLGSTRTFVICPTGTRRVVGFHSLTMASVAKEEPPKKVTRSLGLHPVPVALLARLAVDMDYQDGGLGGALLRDAFMRTLQAASQVGAVALMVHAKDDEAISFYQHYGFEPSPIQALQLFLPLATIRKAMIAAEGTETRDTGQLPTA